MNCFMFSPNKSRQRNWKADSELLNRIYIYCGQRFLWEPFTFLSCLSVYLAKLAVSRLIFKGVQQLHAVWHQCLAIQWHQFNYSRNFIASLAHNISKTEERKKLHAAHMFFTCPLWRMRKQTTCCT